MERPMASSALTTSQSRQMILDLLRSRPKEWVPALALGEVFGIDYQKINCRSSDSDLPPITGVSGYHVKIEDYRITYGLGEDEVRKRTFFCYDPDRED